MSYIACAAASYKVFAALLRNAGEENTKVSVRSIPGYNAASICEAFGGGGHAGAAGCSIRKPLQEAAEEMEAYLVKWEMG